jgi:transposase
MARRKRRKFTAEFKADVVRLCNAGDRSIHQVAKDLDLTETAVREWVQKAKSAEGASGPTGSSEGALSAAEKQELAELRRRVRRLEEEREILKKAAAFFAKESE